jgi:hypothetical protein
MSATLAAVALTVCTIPRVSAPMCSDPGPGDEADPQTLCSLLSRARIPLRAALDQRVTESFERAHRFMHRLDASASIFSPEAGVVVHAMRSLPVGAPTSWPAVARMARSCWELQRRGRLPHREARRPE